MSSEFLWANEAFFPACFGGSLQVSIGDASMGQFCGGTLIAPRWVILGWPRETSRSRLELERVATSGSRDPRIDGLGLGYLWGFVVAACKTHMSGKEP